MRACWKPEGPNAVFRQGLTAQAGIISPSPSGRVPGGTHPPTDQKTLPIKKFRRLAGPLASAPQPSKDAFWSSNNPRFMLNLPVHRTFKPPMKQL